MTNHIPFRNRKITDQFIRRFFYDRYQAFRDEEITIRKRFYYESDEKLAWDFYNIDAFRAELVRNSMRITRIEPENPYLYHTNVPSVRGLNSNEIFYVEIENKQLIVSVYNRSKDKFMVIYSGTTNHEAKMNEFWIVFNKSIIGNIYGDFGYILSLLDAGHVINQMCLVSSLYEESISITYDDFNDLGLRLMNSEMNVIAKVRLPEKTHAISRKRLIENHHKNLCAYSIHEGEIKEKPHNTVLNGYLKELINEGKGEFNDENHNESLSYYNDVALTMANRTSDQSPQGFFGKMLSKNQEEINRIIDFTTVCLKTTARDDYFQVLLIANDNEGDENAFIISNDHASEYGHLSDLDKQNMLKEGHDHFELNGCKYIIYTMISKELTQRPSSMNYAIIKSAEIIHSLALYLTEQTYVTRPMKNIDERYIENYFQLEDRLISYMLIAGKQNHRNLQLSI